MKWSTERWTLRSREVGMCARPLSLDKVDDGPGVVAAVGDEVAIGLEPFDQGRRNGLVRRLTLREHNPYRHALLIDYRVDLGA